MVDGRKESERAELHRTRWNIANDLRGSVNRWGSKPERLFSNTGPAVHFDRLMRTIVELSVAAESLRDFSKSDLRSIDAVSI